MGRTILPAFIFISTTLAFVGCGSVEIAPGSGGGGGAGGDGATSTTGASQSSSGAVTASSTGPKPDYCVIDDDCVGDPGGPLCDDVAGACVECQPFGATCPAGKLCDPTTKTCVPGCAAGSCGPGQYCDEAANACAPGCEDSADCNALVCNPATHTCGECAVDVDCPLGSICAASACIPGCSATQACPAGGSCCGGAGTDLGSDVAHCGLCDVVCPVQQHASAICQMGFCGMGACDVGHANCDQSPQNGCEQNVFVDGPCFCAPGTTKACYLGGPGTENVGPCKTGTATCNSNGTSFGACTGQVLPIFEICGNNVDDDCNGTVDDVPDSDGDGWTSCDGDCCELGAPNCPNPKLVNPGAFEIQGNGVNDDCDPTTSDFAPALCPSVEVLAGVTGVEVAKAMDLCRITTAAPPLAQKRWGLIDAIQILPDGSAPTMADLADIQGYQTAILGSFGNVIVPHKGATMAALSTGRARDSARPGYVDPSPGTSFGRTGSPPAQFLAAHAGLLPSSSGCNGACPHGAGANDGVNVRLTIRAPSNALGFSYDYRFFSGEYGARSCSPYNDFFLTLLQSNALGLPLDHNIAYDSLANLASVNNVRFEVCVAQGCSQCPFGPAELAGTGFDVGGAGAATSWLTVDAPIVAGETFKVDLMVFDVSDDAGDSAVLLDNFRWIPPCMGGSCFPK